MLAYQAFHLLWWCQVREGGDQHWVARQIKEMVQQEKEGKEKKGEEEKKEK